MNKLTKQQENRNENCAIDIIKWLKQNDLSTDVVFIYNGKRLDLNTGKEELASAGDYVDYYNDDTITITFEGSLYELLNGYFDAWGDTSIAEDLYNQFEKILKKYNYYFELGNVWNLALYDLQGGEAK